MKILKCLELVHAKNYLIFQNILLGQLRLETNQTKYQFSRMTLSRKNSPWSGNTGYRPKKIF